MATKHSAVDYPLRQLRRRAVHHPASVGDHLADAAQRRIGSWPFIILQALATAAWITLNLVAAFHHWDPYPWILLNLCYSFQAGFTGPILLLAANRAAARDRARDDLEAQEVHEIMAIQHTQLQILSALVGADSSRPDAASLEP